MTDPAAILRDLAYAKTVFQLRAIKAALHIPASDNAGSLGSAPGALPSGADPALGVRK